MGTIYGLRTNGDEFPIEASISHTEAEGQKLFTVIIRDVAERRRDEERLREQASMLEHAQDAILVRDLDDRILFWNKGAERIYGWTAAEVLAKDIRNFLYKENSEQLEQAKAILLKDGEWRGEIRHLTKDSRKVISLASLTLVRDSEGNPKSILAINTDITATKKLEGQLLRAQRMESIGTLAGGIAHDLNNLLSPILLGVQMLQLQLKQEPYDRMLSVIRMNAERSSELVKQVLSFARGVEGERIILQPRHIVREITKILQETLPKSIILDSNLADDLLPVTGDATQLHQVLMNLCVNARDAMPHGGKLVIEAENIYLDENYSRMSLEAKCGQYVIITVADTGTGMPPEIIDRIFEPFFTTKELNKGTGLGLSTAIGIVRSHGGFINVYSEVGRGTRFKIYLPAAESAAGLVEKSDTIEMQGGRGELVLIVDDEAGIREITRGALETYGYKVLTASDGTEAVALFAQQMKEIDVVLVDMMMPYMDGLATIRALKRLDDKVKIIASSGLKENSRAIEATKLGISAFLPKPYTAEQLLNALNQALG
jgi:PAS domain S-box-containing protein